MNTSAPLIIQTSILSKYLVIRAVEMTALLEYFVSKMYILLACK